jgi:WhiB family redox-sensing transcriptional regulator
MQWRAEAACRDADPELFAEQDAHSNKVWAELEETARLFCTGCPVRMACRADADEHKHTGLWGAVYKWRREGRIRARVFAEPARVPRPPVRAAS